MITLTVRSKLRRVCNRIKVLRLFLLDSVIFPVTLSNHILFMKIALSRNREINGTTLTNQLMCPGYEKGDWYLDYKKNDVQLMKYLHQGSNILDVSLFDESQRAMC